MPLEIQCSNLEQFINTIRKSSPGISRERYLIGGPCGIGKTTFGRLLCQKLNSHFIDHDEAKERVKLNPSPCGASTLKLSDCLSEALKLEGHPDTFVFAIGGDSLFRTTANNAERLVQLVEAREKYALTVIVLFARRDTVKHRFLEVKGRHEGDFSLVWENWLSIERPYWEKCADYFVDTDSLLLVT